MRFDRLRDVTDLPAERLETAFAHEDVQAVLPVCEPDSDEATVLVATPSKLGVATLRRLSGRSRWITRWAPWDAVQLGSRRREADSTGTRAPTPVSIGRRGFRSMLGGDMGRRAWRDFGRYVRERRRAVRGREVAPTT